MKLFLLFHSIKADSDYALSVLLVSGVKRYRPNKIASDWRDFVRLIRNFELTVKKMFDFVRLPNPIEHQSFDSVRLDFCSIGFLFDFVRLDTPGKR